jgi:hypothetical protein
MPISYLLLATNDGLDCVGGIVKAEAVGEGMQISQLGLGRVLALRLLRYLL